MKCYGGHAWSRSNNAAVMPTIHDHERCDCGLLTWGEVRQRALACPNCATLTAERDTARTEAVRLLDENLTLRQRVAELETELEVALNANSNRMG
jgi:hypothetical protein